MDLSSEFVRSMSLCFAFRLLFLSLSRTLCVLLPPFLYISLMYLSLRLSVLSTAGIYCLRLW